MKTDRMTVRRETFEKILNKVNLFAQYCGMSYREGSSMCLLAEEMVASVRVILDTIDGTLWMENEGGQFSIHLAMDTYVSEEERGKLIGLSKGGKNSPPRGFLARVGMVLDNFFLADNGCDLLYPDATMIGSVGLNGEFAANYQVYSYQQYKRENAVKVNEKADEYEGIERSIIEALADDITVTVKSHSIELVALKALPKDETLQ